jgi:hypothetical protein
MVDNFDNEIEASLVVVHDDLKAFQRHTQKVKNSTNISKLQQEKSVVAGQVQLIRDARSK